MFLKRTPLVLFLFCLALSAHDLYLMPSLFRVEPGFRLRIAVRNGDSFPESEVAPSLERLRDGKLRSRAKTSQIAAMKVVGAEAVGYAQTLGPGVLQLSIYTAPNSIELPSTKFEDYLREEGLDDVIVWRTAHRETSKPGRERYSKFAKSLILSGRSDQFFAAVEGFPIEIVVQRNPYRLHAGDTLPVVTLFRGKPAPGVQLEASWSDKLSKKTVVVGRTDNAGRITIPLKEAGLWRLHTLKMVRCTDSAGTDWESFWASLTFEIR